MSDQGRDQLLLILWPTESIASSVSRFNSPSWGLGVYRTLVHPNAEALDWPVKPHWFTHYKLNFDASFLMFPQRLKRNVKDRILNHSHVIAVS
jgi:hypothetical protein